MVGPVEGERARAFIGRSGGCQRHGKHQACCAGGRRGGHVGLDLGGRDGRVPDGHVAHLAGVERVARPVATADEAGIALNVARQVLNLPRAHLRAVLEELDRPVGVHRDRDILPRVHVDRVGEADIGRCLVAGHPEIKTIGVVEFEKDIILPGTAAEVENAGVVAGSGRLDPNPRREPAREVAQAGGGDPVKICGAVERPARLAHAGTIAGAIDRDGRLAGNNVKRVAVARPAAHHPRVHWRGPHKHLAALAVADCDRHGKLPHTRIGVAGIDAVIAIGERDAAIGRGRGADRDRRGAVAPVDCGREQGRVHRRVGVGEGGHRAAEGRVEREADSRRLGRDLVGKRPGRGAGGGLNQAASVGGGDARAHGHIGQGQCAGGELLDVKRCQGAVEEGEFVDLAGEFIEPVAGREGGGVAIAQGIVVIACCVTGLSEGTAVRKCAVDIDLFR